ncbi:MAG: N(G),N(G)-dimethylarginine dimethylaminohydrolase [Ilumatobacteraceae bacterium]|nr:N(G),N(G)-dimethylarginine dimethylaminohydrolase [Ilumatobacteraceae bacterium]
MGQDHGVPGNTPAGVRALVRQPGRRLPEGLLTHFERTEIDVDLAFQQWHGYVDALKRNGWETIEVPAADHCPDAVFIEDTIVMFGDLAVISLPGAPSRQPETAAVDETVGRLGYKIAKIEPPSTLDGGDVLKVGNTVYVGLGGRTNAAGIAQLAVHLEPHGATVIPVPVTKVLHLKSAVTALPDGTVVGWPAAVDDPAIFPMYLETPEESGAHVVLLGENRLLMAADCPLSAAMYRSMGYEPVEVDIGEFQKLEGCVTCLSVRLRS